MNNYELADIAEKFFGTPYVWGGNDIETGMDCSAFVSECLRSVGKLPNGRKYKRYFDNGELEVME